MEPDKECWVPRTPVASVQGFSDCSWRSLSAFRKALLQHVLNIWIANFQYTVWNPLMENRLTSFIKRTEIGLVSPWQQVGVCDSSAAASFLLVLWLFWVWLCFVGRMGKRMNRLTFLFNLAVLPLSCPVSSHTSQRSDSIMYVHNAQFSSRTFSIIFPVNSLVATLSLLHVFVEGGGPGSPSAFTLLMQSLHQTDTQPLWQITPICLSVYV